MTNKRFALMIVALLSLSAGLMAQNRVIIGAKRAPNENARLEVTNPDGQPGGLLLPYVALASTTLNTPLAAGTTASSDHSKLKGMLVYNTATASDVTPGIYYNDGTKWVSLAGLKPNDLPNFWKTTGNQGTTAATNFLGTTDNNPLVLKVNNINSGFISAPNLGKNNTALGYGALINATSTTSSSNTAVGTEALSKYVSGVTTKEALGANVAIGRSAMGAITKGSFNTAVGNGALAGSDASDSWNNVAIGVSTLGQITTGGINTAVGGSAMVKTTTGSGNVALGLDALSSLTTGSGNIAIGYSTGNTVTGNYNIAIGGHNVGVPNAAGNRQLNIANLITGTGLAAGVFADNATAQEATPKVGIAQASNVITETFDVNGTTRLRNLPTNGAVNAISTTTAGGNSGAKDQTFTASRTVVVDANGVLGTVPGLPVTGLPDIKTMKYTRSTTTIDASTPTNSIAKIGLFEIRYDATSAGAAGRYFSIRLAEANNFSAFMTVNKQDGTSSTGTVMSSATAGEWKQLSSTYANIPVINTTNGDSETIMIYLENSQKLYRVSALSTVAKGASNGIPAVPARITIFVEELE